VRPERLLTLDMDTIASAAVRDVTCAPAEEVPTDNPSPTLLTTRNDTLMYETQNYGIAHEPALVGAQRMYPEYARKIASQCRWPKRCTGYCCGGQDVDASIAHFSYWALRRALRASRSGSAPRPASAIPVRRLALGRRLECPRSGWNRHGAPLGARPMLQSRFSIHRAFLRRQLSTHARTAGDGEAS
jgi:hypothetical protein